MSNTSMKVAVLRNIRENLDSVDVELSKVQFALWAQGQPANRLTETMMRQRSNIRVEINRIQSVINNLEVQAKQEMVDES